MNPQRIIRPTLNAFKAGTLDIDETIENIEWVVNHVKWEFFVYGIVYGITVALIVVKFL